MTNSAVLPWQQQNLEHVLQLRQADRLPHAMMLCGLPGTGIREFADALARLLMCSEGGMAACGRCHSCELNAAGTHPDLRVLEPDKAAAKRQ